MTVQELIDELNKIENKNQPVFDSMNAEILRIYEEDGDVILSDEDE